MNAEEFLAKYYDQGVAKLDGWFNKRDAEVIYIIDQLQKANNIRGDICEIGVYKGKSLLFFEKLLRDDENVFGLDRFIESRGENYVEVLISSVKTSATKPERVKLFKGYSQDFNYDTSFVGNNIRILHIDGDHDHPGVLHDLRAFYPLLRKGDEWVIIMDDLPNRDFPGVSSAVWDFIYRYEGKDLKAFAATPNKMYFCHRNRVQMFREAIEKKGINVVHRVVDDVTIVVTDPKTTENLRNGFKPVSLG